jgi:uracil-DNA glycosylase
MAELKNHLETLVNLLEWSIPRISPEVIILVGPYPWKYHQNRDH